MSQCSKEQAGSPQQELLGPQKQTGLLNKEPTGPLWRPLVMGPLEQDGAPDQEPMESHGTSGAPNQKTIRARDSKSRVNGAP